jgi:FhaA, N-terminal domain/FHA domain
MGFLGRFEKKVEGAVSGVFARAFKGDVQPVEIAARLQRELDTEAKLMSRDKRLVPNEFVVALSQHDYDKLVPYSGTLTTELATELRRHAGEMGYVFNGPIRIHFELEESLPIGRFTVTSEAVAGVESSRPSTFLPDQQAHPVSGRTDEDQPPPMFRPESASPASPGPAGPGSHGAGGPSVWSDPAGWGASRPTPGPRGRDQLVLEVNGTRHPLSAPGFVIGRGTEADLRINDPGVSRMHAEIRVSGTGEDQTIDIIDLGSTNGIVVNGQKVRQSALTDGTRIEIGSTRMLVHAPSGR